MKNISNDLMLIHKACFLLWFNMRQGGNIFVRYCILLTHLTQMENKLF